MSYRVVWFKRDLRTLDHAPLSDAARQGPVLCLYVIEPALWRLPDAASQHYRFILECLDDLRQDLKALGAELQVVVGEVVEVLGRLHAQRPFSALHAHEETGNAVTFARDRAVQAWCRHQGVTFREWPQVGVVRGLRDRNRWQAAWERHMAQPCAAVAPLSGLKPPPVDWAAMGLSTQAPAPQALGLDPWDPPQRQRGGRLRGENTWKAFLTQRSERYRGGISSPLSAPDACSRLSPYLAYGCLSMREVVQATRQALQDSEPDPRRAKGLQGFQSRLYWHCHFIQKLESEPEIEWRAMHRGYEGLREADWNEAHFQALQAGRTGWPMVDACVAMLRQTGWLNFRMRAMLVSVAAYPLWLHWRPVGEWLARQFLDYEPGIHWSQMQMQSGTTGINTTRVYNPIKQAQDHDPQGRFVRQWLPHLRQVPDSWLLEPWRMPANVQTHVGLQVGQDIPVPPVALETALRQAKDRLHQRRRQDEVQQLNHQVVVRHGSRRGMPGHPAADRAAALRAAHTSPQASAADQLSLDF